MSRIFSLLVCCCLFFSLPVLAEDLSPLTVTPVRFKTTFETLDLPAGENMGLLGGSFLFDTTDWLAVGGSTYGAITGERGGFITLGLTAELRKKLFKNGEVNAGIFVGAGGGHGGYALQGGGLMLRYHLGGQFNLQRWGNLGAGFSYVDFPNGSIHSLQPYISYEYPFRSLLPSGWLSSSRGRDSINPLATVEQEFSAVYRRYDIPADVLTDSGGSQHPTIELMGVEWHRFLTDSLFLKIESAGAMGGESNGYMQILLGAGGRLQLTESTALKLSVSAGFGGGGAVATGGGLLVDTAVALQQDLGRHLFVEISGGYTDAPDGSFEATHISAKLGSHFKTPQVPDRKVLLSDLGSFAPQHLRIRMIQQNYFKGADGWRNHHADQEVRLLGLQLDSFQNDHFYLSGQGIAAYQGQAGGYMTGLVGGGVHLPLFDSPLFLELETLVGAAGGGGLDVAGGFVWQGNAALGYQLSDCYSIIGTYGYMSAPKGDFRAMVLGLTLAYRFNFFTEI